MLEESFISMPSCLARFAKLENLDLLVPEIGMEAFNGLVLNGGDDEKQKKVRRWLQGWLESSSDFSCIKE